MMEFSFSTSLLFPVAASMCLGATPGSMNQMDMPTAAVTIQSTSVSAVKTHVAALEKLLSATAAKAAHPAGMTAQKSVPPVIQATAAAFAGPRTPVPALQNRSKPKEASSGAIAANLASGAESQSSLTRAMRSLWLRPGCLEGLGSFFGS